DAREQRHTQRDGAMHGIGGADVAAQDADVGRASAPWDLLAGDDVDQLLLATGGVAPRNDHRFDVGAGGSRQNGRDRGGFAVLGGDHTVARLHDVLEDAYTRDDVGGALDHERLVRGDV